MTNTATQLPLADISLPHKRSEVLRTDFLDASYWAKVASANGLRLPLWRERCTPAKMEKWLKRIGMSVSAYYEITGFKSLREFGQQNPDWPLRAWVGLLIERKYRDIEPDEDAA